MTETPRRRRRRAFFAPDDFPELAVVQSQWRALRDEAVVALTALGPVLGVPPSQSYILPVVPEAQDRDLVTDDICARARAMAPLAMQLAGDVPYVIGCAFSRLTPGKHIAPHYHSTPYLTAILCLDDGGRRSHIIVDGQRRDFVDGELTIFDYTHEHESRNEGERDRIVMLLLIDPRRITSTRASTPPTR